ncbi:MAG: aryldialkylphosphatase [Chloroflexi bacterium]|nr:aryldialkylphosphatase [Chloroflexota bacterium]MCL5107755.1 aryldialkylphosphatase [Chloroflexota bacterium]
MKAMSVLGPVDPALLGFTQPHEHLLCDLHKVVIHTVDGLLNDEALAAEELLFFKRAGGGTLVDVTNRGLGRNPAAVKRISQATGVHLIVGCGWYRGRFYDESIDRTPTNDLAADMVRDVEEGIDGTGIRAGIIGEIGAEGSYLTAAEERVLRAAGRAHRRTGAAVTTHAVGYPLGVRQLDILAEEGVDPRRVIVGHCDHYLFLDYQEAILRRGAYVEFDNFGNKIAYSDERRIAMLLELLRLGFERQIVLATDVCLRSHLHAYGGHGYDHILTAILPALREKGVSEEQLHLLTVENPARVLAF